MKYYMFTKVKGFNKRKCVEICDTKEDAMMCLMSGTADTMVSSAGLTEYETRLVKRYQSRQKD